MSTKNCLMIGLMSKTILEHKIKDVGELTWILGSKSQMWASTINLKNKLDTPTVYVPNISTMKLKPSEDTNLELFNFVENVCHVKDFLETSSHPFRSECSTSSNFAIKMCHYFHCNVGMQNSNRCVGLLAPNNSTLECKVCQIVPICIVACNECIVYIHFLTHGMSTACRHLGSYGHHVSNASCHEYMKIAY